MSNKHHLQANSLRSNDGENIVVREVKINLDQLYSAAQFDDDELIQKYAVLDLLTGLGLVPAEEIVIPAGSVLTGGNFNIDYSPYTAHGNHPRLELNLVNGDGSEDIQFIGIHKNKTAGNITSIDLFLADDGTGHSTFDYVLVIQ